MTAIVASDRDVVGLSQASPSATPDLKQQTMASASALAKPAANTNTSELATRSNLDEELVQAWLDTHKGWFQLYAIENLDANTVEKWLRTNGKRVCKCKNPSAETMMSANINLSARVGKRNSIAGLIPAVIDDITGKEYPTPFCPY